MFEEVIVFGAGAIGSTFGALLSLRTTVTLIGREPHVKAIRKNGLQLANDVSGTFHVHAETEMKHIPPRALLLLTTKAHESQNALNQLRSLLKEDTVILVLQNGLGNEAIIRKQLKNKAEVLRGLTDVAAEFLTPGKIRFWKNQTVIEDGSAADKIRALFKSAGLETEVSKGFLKDTWRKLTINCIINPLTALLQARNDEIVTETLKPIRQEIARECTMVAAADGVNLEINIDECDAKIKGYHNFSSMSQDVIKGKTTEIDFLNGKVVELGKHHHISTPVNTTLTSLIKSLEG